MANTKYANLQELAAAFSSGALKKDEYTLVLDNDGSWLRYTGPLPEGVDHGSRVVEEYLGKKENEASELFQGNGYGDLLDACLAAGIPAEWC